MLKSLCSKRKELGEYSIKEIKWHNGFFTMASFNLVGIYKDYLVV